MIPYVMLFFIGILNALPLTGSSLPLYLAECGCKTDEIALFCLLSFPLSMKILWSALIDHVDLPFCKTCPRKGWLLFSILGIALSFLGLGLSDPKDSLWLFSSSLLLLALFGGCLYMVGIAYELESIPESQYGTGSASTIAGYRTGLLYTGAGTLFIAHLFSWQLAFFSAAAVAMFGAIAVILLPEPYQSRDRIQAKRTRLSQQSSVIKGFFSETIIEPCRTFFKQPDWLAILVIILLFKAGDHLSKHMEGPFYLAIGFDKADLALASKTWGFAATIAGAFFASAFTNNKNPLVAVTVLSLIHTLSIFGCYLHSVVGKSFWLLYLTSGIGNFTGGMVMTAFISLLWKRCNKQYAPVQYALLMSLSSLNTHLLSCCGGFLAAALAWPQFFMTACLLGLTCGLALLLFVRQTEVQDQAHEIQP